MNLKNTCIMNNYLFKDDETWCGNVDVKSIIYDGKNMCKNNVDKIIVPDNILHMKETSIKMYKK